MFISASLFSFIVLQRVRLYYNRVPNSGETAENVLVKNDDSSLIFCSSFAVVFKSVAIVSFTFSFPRGCS